MKRILIGLSLLALSTTALAAPPAKEKSKFYDFGVTVIDGDIKKPTALYASARQKAEFGRLLKLKKSFLPAMFQTAHDPALR